MSDKVPTENEGGSGGLKAKLAARFKKRTEDTPEKKKQLQDYTAWVNNYLRRKPGTALISDLRFGLGDGITFVHLVEIVARTEVTGVEKWPSTTEGRRLNTERALELLRADGVVLHQDACRDLVEGSVKGVMKVILAIAERYQPKSVKPREVTRLNPDSQRQEPIRPYPHHHRLEPSLSQFHTTHHPATTVPYPKPEEVYSSPIDQLPANNPTQVISAKKKVALPPVSSSSGTAGIRTKATAHMKYGMPEDLTDEWAGPAMVRVEERGAGLVEEVGAVLSGLTEFKTELLQLHAILLRNNNGVHDVGGTPVGGATVETDGETRAELLTEVTSLRERLGHIQDEYTQIEAECIALRNMVDERNAFITTIKSEIYRKEYLNDTQRAELQTQLLHKDTHIKKLETDLESCHGNLEAAETELGTVRGDLEQSQETVEWNRARVEQLQNELATTTSSEEKLSQRLSVKEKKLVTSEEKLAEERERGARHMLQLSEELEIIAEGLAQLAAESASPDHLESLQKAVGDMAAKLDNSTSPARRRRREEEHSRHRRKRRDRQEPHPPATPSSPNKTRVLYYMAGDNKSEVPFVAIVPKKASEVTLKDFKAVFGRHGDHKFFFKTEDPDCGVVKEEVTGDDQILPSLKGKVIAWIRGADITTVTQ